MTEHCPIRIVAGLGNPGQRYERTRHNAGLWFVDLLVRRHGGSFRAERRYQGEVAEIELEGCRVLLLKPGTFMNRCGASVRSLAAYLKVPPEAVLVAHDDLDLPPGTARLKRGGGPGGHNGLKDVIAHLGREFFRLRLGVGHPGHQNQVIDYVLQRPGPDDERAIEEAVERAADVFPVLVAQGDQRAMTRLHSPPAPGAGNGDR
jgi:PTH1 family peptidyl-tRNA hydrolase